MAAFEPWSKEQGAAIIAAHAGCEGAALPILHALQAEFGYVPKDAIPMIAAALNITRAEMHGIVTFYHDFRDHPPGRHVLRLCRAEACQSLGADALAAQACARSRDRLARHHAGRRGDAGAGVLPRPVRHRTSRHAGRAPARTARRGTGRGRTGDRDVTVRIYIPRDAAALALGADAVAAALVTCRTEAARNRNRAHRLARAVLAGADDRDRNARRAASPTDR